MYCSGRAFRKHYDLAPTLFEFWLQYTLFCRLKWWHNFSLKTMTLFNTVMQSFLYWMHPPGGTIHQYIHKSIGFHLYYPACWQMQKNMFKSVLSFLEFLPSLFYVISFLKPALTSKGDNETTQNLWYWQQIMSCVFPIVFKHDSGLELLNFWFLQELLY